MGIGEVVLLIGEIREALVDVTVENRFYKMELAPKSLNTKQSYLHISSS